jgi:hypothetical protein
MEQNRPTRLRRPLTRNERDRLRGLVDAARRQAIDWEVESRCSGCGVEQRDSETGELRYSDGCRTCADRRSGHRRRMGSGAMSG